MYTGKMSDKELFDALKKLVKSKRSGKVSYIGSGSVKCYIAYKIENSDKITIVGSGMKKFRCRIEKKGRGFIIIPKPIMGIEDSAEILDIIEKIIKKLQNDDKKLKENKKGIKITVGEGFSVRQCEYWPTYQHNKRIEENESNINYKTAKKCGLFTKEFIDLCKDINARCYFKKAS